MSFTRTMQTEMTDKSCLMEALKKQGFKPTELEKPEQIRGHYGEKSQEKCDIVLRQEDHGRKADIGFVKGEDGKYKVVTDTYVNRDLQDLAKFTDGLKKDYLVAHAKKIARKNGHQVIGEKVLANGKTRLMIKVA